MPKSDKPQTDWLLSILIRLMMIVWTATKIMSWKLWLNDRTFPLVPYVSIPHSFHLILFILFFILSTLLLIKPLQPYLLCFLLLVEIISLFGDELRWQPWEYQFLFICLAVVFGRRNPRIAVNGIIFIFSSSYFFSGISKLNLNFLNNIWLRLMLIKVLHLPKAVYFNSFVKYIGLFIPLIEIICGILLLIPKYIKITGWLSICIHLFIIIYISPLFYNNDYIVFPWNIFMMSVVYLLFIRHRTVFSVGNLFSKQSIVITCSWIVLPIAGIFGYWPSFFSFKLYSGVHMSMNVYLLNTVNVPSELKPYIRHSTKGYYDLNVYFHPFDWCNNELKVPIPPERHIYESLQDTLEEKYKALYPVFRYY